MRYFLILAFLTGSLSASQPPISGAISNLRPLGYITSREHRNEITIQPKEKATHVTIGDLEGLGYFLQKTSITRPSVTIRGKVKLGNLSLHSPEISNHTSQPAELTLDSCQLSHFMAPSPSQELSFKKTLFGLLTILSLRNNRITSLPPSMLAGLPHLENLDLAHNQVTKEKIDPKALKGCSRALSILNVHGNPCAEKASRQQVIKRLKPLCPNLNIIWQESGEL